MERSALFHIPGDFSLFQLVCFLTGKNRGENVDFARFRWKPGNSVLVDQHAVGISCCRDRIECSDLCGRVELSDSPFLPEIGVWFRFEIFPLLSGIPCHNQFPAKKIHEARRQNHLAREVVQRRGSDSRGIIEFVIYETVDAA